MTRSVRLFILSLSLILFCGLPAGYGQKPTAQDKAAAYFNFSMAHYYGELAAAYGNRGDYYRQAIDYYKQALKLDPSATFLLEELTDLYVQGNQLKAAITEPESLLKQNPENIQPPPPFHRIYIPSTRASQHAKN